MCPPNTAHPMGHTDNSSIQITTTHTVSSPHCVQPCRRSPQHPQAVQCSAFSMPTFAGPSFVLSQCLCIDLIYESRTYAFPFAGAPPDAPRLWEVVAADEALRRARADTTPTGQCSGRMIQISSRSNGLRVSLKVSQVSVIRVHATESCGVVNKML